MKSNKKCDFVDLFEFSSTFWNLVLFKPRKLLMNFRQIFDLRMFTFYLVNWTYVPREIEQKVHFLDLFKFSSTFWNLIHFRSRKFWLNFKKLLLKFIFIFCLVNCTYVPRWFEQNVWLCRYFWIFVYVLELKSFSASQTFNKFQ